MSAYRRLSKRLWVMLPGAAILSTAFRLADAPDLIPRLVQRLQDFYAVTAPEKTYLHLDKPCYTAGDIIWFKAYAVDGVQHRADTLSRVLYVDLLDPAQRVIGQRTLRLEQGTAAGDLALPDSAASGSYTVRAYTSWMRNAPAGFLFSRALPVLGTKAAVARKAPRAAAPQYAFQLFPEGGYLVTGIPTTLAFKARDAAGRGVAVQGELLDDQGRSVAAFRSLHAGMGAVPGFVPVAGRRYSARVQWPDGSRSTVAVPEALPAGLSLHAEQDAGQVRVQLASQAPAGAAPTSEDVTLIAHVRGQVAYVGRATLKPGQAVSTRIPLSRFASGVAHLTLFDAAGVARCERLLFVNQADELRVTVRPDQASYGLRQPVKLTVETRDAAGQPVAAQLSLAVTSAELNATPGAADAPTILSHLLLTSDLAGPVEDAGFYFRPGNAAAPAALDHLLLTQGWRRFVWRELLAGELPALAFAPERSLSLTGQVLRTEHKPLPYSALSLMSSNRGQAFGMVTADAQGRFQLTDLPGQDTTQVLVQARTPKGGQAPLLRLTDRWAPVGELLPPALLPTASASMLVQRSRAQQRLDREFGPDTARRIVLKNVTIKGKRPAPEPADPRRIFTGASVTLRADDIPQFNAYPNPLLALQGRVSGITVMEGPGGVVVRIRSGGGPGTNSAPLILLDGMPIGGPYMPATAMQTGADGVSKPVNYAELPVLVPSVDIETIDVFKGPAAAAFGPNGINGVIALYTRRSARKSRSVTTGVAQAWVPAYYQAREFYVPAPARRASAQPDARGNTLYWAPTVTTDAQGRAEVQFYTSDDVGAFRAEVQGLGAAGQPGIGTANLEVRLR